MHVCAIAVLACAGLTACGAKPPANQAAAPQPAPRTTDVPLAVDTLVVESRVGTGVTLASLLRASRIAERDIAALVARAAAVFDLRRIRSAQPFRLEQVAAGATVGPQAGLVRRFEYEIDRDRFLRVTRVLSESGGTDDPAFVAEVLPIEKTRSLELVRGRIDRETPSLFAAMQAAGEAIELPVSLAEIFSGDIDFNTDLQPGDQFALLVEKQHRATHELAGYGPILAAEFDNAGRRYRAVRFAPSGGQAGYYDERGVSMRRFFLQSPLKFVPTVTSSFSRSRLHPILKEYRAHLGVDYRAPAGSPVVAVADGVVVEARASGGAGRLVHLRHANGIETEYLHLSTIAVRVGAHVAQGDLIGRVGASGLATGPHLDYRVRKHGVFINPLHAQKAMPPAAPVPPSQMSAFVEIRDHAFAALASPAVALAVTPKPTGQQ